MISLETGMMIAFVLAFAFSMLKFYAFMPTKPLADDDMTAASSQELMRLMYKAIKAGKRNKEHIEAFIKMDDEFDQKHF